MRKYTIVDMIRFAALSKDNPDVKGIDLIKKYNVECPELSPKDQVLNLSKALGINSLHKAITGHDIPEDDELYLSWKSLNDKFESEYCDFFDGTGTYEGGKYLETKCPKCNGQGVVNVIEK